MSCYEKLKTSNMWSFHIIFILISKFFVSGLIFKYVSFLMFENSWDQLIAKGVTSLIFAIIAKIVFNKFKSDMEEIEEGETILNKKKK